MLPDELLIYIFDVVYASLNFLRGDELHARTIKREVAWMRVLSVCRRWRQLILGTPKYWRIINVYNRAHWLQFCVPLSKDVSGRALAGVYFRKESFSRSLLTALLASDIAPHIATLSFAVRAETFKFLPNVLLRRLPNLTALSLCCIDIWFDAALAGLSPQRLARLTSLTLVNVGPPSNLAQYNNLRVLELSTPPPWDISMDELLNILDVWSSQLESLRLDRARSSTTHANLGSSRAPSSLTFPCLRKIYLANPRPFNTRFLSYLRLPSATDVFIRDDVSHLEDEEFSDLDQAFSALLPQDPASIVPFLSAITSVEFIPWRMEYVFRGKSDAHSLHLEIYKDSDYPLYWAHLTQSGLRDILELLSQADIRRFEIETNYDYDHFTQDDFEAAFKAFPNLDSLRLNGENPFEYVLELLAPRSAEVSSSIDPLSDEMGASRNTAGEMLCSRLRNLIIGDLSNRWGQNNELMAKILDILRARAEQGTRLDRFEIYLMHEEEIDHEKAAKEYVPLLQGLVGKVVYGNHEYVEYDWERDMGL